MWRKLTVKAVLWASQETFLVVVISVQKAHISQKISEETMKLVLLNKMDR